MLAEAVNLYHAAHTRRVSAAGLALLQAKLPGNSSQIARGRILLFESNMPSHPVVSNRRSAKEKPRPEGAMMSPRTVVEKSSVSVPLGWSTTAFQAYEKDLWDSFDANVAR